MSRLDDDILTLIADLENELGDIKSTQFMGKDIIRPQISKTNASYDISVAGNSQTVKTIELTADHQLNPNGIVVFDVWRSSVGNFATKGTFEITIQDIRFAKDDSKLQWMHNIYNNASGTIYLKAYIYASDTGAVVVS